MGFGFAPVDQLQMPQGAGGLDAPQVNMPTPVAAPAPMPAPAPQPQQSQGQPYKPSLWDILQGVVFDSQSPAEAAMAARQRDYQQHTMQLMAQTLQHASPAELKAILTNPAKYGEEFAKNFAPVTTAEGATQSMFGGPGAGGSRFTAPKFGIDKESGKPYVVTPQGGGPTGDSLGGDFSVNGNGAEVSARTGLTGRAISLPQIVPAGSGPGTFTPSVSGPGAPLSAAPGAPSSPAPGAGHPPSPGGLDPIAFFKSFVLPHEGGLNPRDLNGAPTKYGINQKANPGVDVTKIGPDDAARIFADKYFANSGAAHLAPAMAAVHADTSFINPKKAAEFLTQSGGDPGKYMDMREAWMGDLVKKYPDAARYEKAWSSRNTDLRAVATKLGGGQAPAGSSSPAAGWTGGQPRHPEIVPQTDPAYAALPKGTVLQRAPDGTMSVLQHPEYDPQAKNAMRDKVLTSPEYTQAKGAMSAFQAMVANSGAMTGPAGYAILDTFARAINPGAVARPQVIDTISKSLGVPNQVVGNWYNLIGHGKLSPQARQQIIDAVTPFAQAHWDQANLMNQANSALAAKHGFDPYDVTAPLEGRPERVVVETPCAAQRQPGQVYVTPKGPLRWTGQHGKEWSTP